MVRSILIPLLLVFVSIQSTGCKKWRQTADEAIVSFNNAIDSLHGISDTWDENSDDWQRIIVELQGELDDDFTRYIDRLENIIQDGQRALFNLTTCSTQFFIESIIYQIELLRNEFTGSISSSVANSPVSASIILCHSDLTEISLSEGVELMRWTVNGYFGSIGSEIDIRLLVVETNGNQSWYPNTVTRSSNNQLRVDITNLYYAAVLNDAYSVQLVDGASNNKLLGEYRIYP